jgi:heat shock protein HslJ
MGVQRLITRLVRGTFVTVMVTGTVAGLAACGQGGAGGGATAPVTWADLDGRAFTASSGTRDGEPLQPVQRTSLTLRFDSEQLAASAGCNSMFGAVSLDGDVLAVQALASTQMACDEAIMRQEQWFGTFLTSRPTLSLAGSTLALTSGGDVITFEEQQPVADAELIGTTWELTGIVTGAGPDAAVSTVPSGVTATLLLDKEGRVFVDAGCNRISGTFRQRDQVVEFGPLASTKMACPKPVAQVEQAMLGVLSGPVPYAIDGDQLSLTGTDSGLTFTAAKAG